MHFIYFYNITYIWLFIFSVYLTKYHIKYIYSHISNSSFTNSPKKSNPNNSIKQNKYNLQISHSLAHLTRLY